MNSLPFVTKREELANTLTHAFCIPFICFSIKHLLVSNPKRRAGNIIFWFSLLFCYSCSSIYHWCDDHDIKIIFRYLDHCSIFFLIAGTYTPFGLLTIHRIMGLLTFLFVWMMAIIGVICKIAFFERFSKISIFYSMY